MVNVNKTPEAKETSGDSALNPSTFAESLKGELVGVQVTEEFDYPLMTYVADEAEESLGFRPNSNFFGFEKGKLFGVSFLGEEGMDNYYYVSDPVTGDLYLYLGIDEDTGLYKQASINGKGKFFKVESLEEGDSLLFGVKGKGGDLAKLFRYETLTGKLSVFDPSSGEMVEMDDFSGAGNIRRILVSAEIRQLLGGEVTKLINEVLGGGEEGKAEMFADQGWVKYYRTESFTQTYPSFEIGFLPSDGDVNNRYKALLMGFAISGPESDSFDTVNWAYDNPEEALQKLESGQDIYKETVSAYSPKSDQNVEVKIADILSGKVPLVFLRGKGLIWDWAGVSESEVKENGLTERRCPVGIYGVAMLTVLEGKDGSQIVVMVHNFDQEPADAKRYPHYTNYVYYMEIKNDLWREFGLWNNIFNEEAQFNIFLVNNSKNWDRYAEPLSEEWEEISSGLGL